MGIDRVMSYVHSKTAAGNPAAFLFFIELVSKILFLSVIQIEQRKMEGVK